MEDGPLINLAVNLNTQELVVQGKSLPVTDFIYMQEDNSIDVTSKGLNPSMKVKVLIAKKNEGLKGAILSKGLN